MILIHGLTEVMRMLHSFTVMHKKAHAPETERESQCPGTETVEVMARRPQQRAPPSPPFKQKQQLRRVTPSESMQHARYKKSGFSDGMLPDASTIKQAKRLSTILGGIVSWESRIGDTKRERERGEEMCWGEAESGQEGALRDWR